MRKLLFICLFLSTALHISAQESKNWRIEVEAGVSCSVLDADVSNLQASSYKVRPGIVIGASAERLLVEGLSVGVGIRFAQRNYLFEKTKQNAWNTLYTNNFIDIPLTVGYYLIHNPYKEKGIWLKPQVGVYYEYFTGMHTSGSYPIYVMQGANEVPTYLRYKSSYDFSANDNHLRRSLFGGKASIKMGYSLKSIDIFVGYSYHYGFSHIYQDKATTTKTTRRNSMTMTAGVAYKF